MATSYVPTYILNICVDTNPLKWKWSWITHNRTTNRPPQMIMSTQVMPVAFGESIKKDGVQQSMNDLERKLKRVTKDRDEF